MTYRVADLKNIGPVYARLLKSAGVGTTNDLLSACATRKGRADTAEKTGIDAAQLLKWTNMADLMRISGVGEEHSDLLEAAGVDTVKELRKRRADNLAARMAQVNESRALLPQTPSENQVAEWVEVARRLDTAIVS